MDITWLSIFKVFLVGIGTYILIPAILMVRDNLIWLFIKKFIINEKFNADLRKYAFLQVQWNERCVSSDAIKGELSQDGFSINGNSFKKDEFGQHFIDFFKVQDELNRLNLVVVRKSRKLDLLLFHYKQIYENPIKSIIDSEIKAQSKIFSEKK